MFGQGRRRRPQPAQTVELGLAQIVMAPHHAFRHARGAAGVDEQKVVWRPLDPQGRAAAGRGEVFISLREVRRRIVFTDLNERGDLGQPVLQLEDCFAKLGAVDDGLRIRVVEDVEHLVGLVAVVDVHVRQAALEAGGQGLAVLWAVAHVERHLVARLRAPGQDRARKIVRPTRRLPPGDRSIPMNEGRRVRREGLRERVEDIAEIPGHRHAS